MAKQVGKKEPQQAGPLVIIGAVVVLVLVLGFCWYRYMGPGVDSGIPHSTKNVPPKESIPAEIRAMYEKQPAAGQGAPRVGVEPH